MFCFILKPHNLFP